MQRNGDENLIEDQISYYDQRAAEYNAEKAAREPFPDDVDRLEKAFAEFAPTGSVLEIACGPGNWTKKLLSYADSITAIDASQRMLERARALITDPKVHFELTDVFRWRPDHKYDLVFFSFWLSHVPSGLFPAFWNLVDRCLEPKGRVFFVDEGPNDYWKETYIHDEVVRRRLSDGSEHSVVKKFWTGPELERALHSLGWNVRVTHTGPFYWGEGTRA
jgi:SAM-dependent methyltransferase